MADGVPRDAELAFWGEWEAQSRIVTRLKADEVGLPRYMHEPRLEWPPEETSIAKAPQNTDPFVFGPNFLYTCCQQYRARRPTQLANLLPGSVILFGSHLRGSFVIDTVFVVKSSQPHAAIGQHLSDRDISETYRLATVNRIYGSDPELRWRLYYGATPEDPIDGMFSFFPCIVALDDQPGFSRPEICLPGVVNPRHKQSYKLMREENGAPQQFHELWQSVVKQVTASGCEVGVHAALPPTIILGPDPRLADAGIARCS